MNCPKCNAEATDSTPSGQWYACGAVWPKNGAFIQGNECKVRERDQIIVELRSRIAELTETNQSGHRRQAVGS